MARAIEQAQPGKADHSLICLTLYGPDAKAVRIEISVVSNEVEEGIRGCHRASGDPAHHHGIGIDCRCGRNIGLMPAAQDQSLGFQGDQ